MTDIQQSLFDESNRIEEQERLNRIHKTAFRVAFDFLEKHDPPENTEEYWLQTCEDINYTSADNITNELCQELLGAVLRYLSEKVKNDA